MEIKSKLAQFEYKTKQTVKVLKKRDKGEWQNAFCKGKD